MANLRWNTKAIYKICIEPTEVLKILGGGWGETISYVVGMVGIGFTYLPKYISRGLFNLG